MYSITLVVYWITRLGVLDYDFRGFMGVHHYGTAKNLCTGLRPIYGLSTSKMELVYWITAVLSPGQASTKGEWGQGSG